MLHHNAETMDYDFHKKLVREVVKEEITAAFELYGQAFQPNNQGQPLPERRHLTRAEVKEQYAISERTLINWEHRGLKSHQVGRKKYYLITDIEHFLKFEGS